MYRLMISAALAATLATQVSAEECKPLMTDLSFCDDGFWEEFDLDLPDGMKVWRSGSEVTAKVVAQMLPRGVGNDPEVVMEAIKDSVRASQDDPDAVTFSQHYLHADARFDRGIIAYELMAEDKAVQLHHSFMIAGNMVIQFMTYSDITDSAGNLELHRDFVTSFKVIEGQTDA